MAARLVPRERNVLAANGRCWCLNKTDDKPASAMEFTNGFDPVEISAEHGDGVADPDEIVKRLEITGHANR
jgi:hypothetical protein